MMRHINHTKERKKKKTSRKMLISGDKLFLITFIPAKYSSETKDIKFDLTLEEFSLEIRVASFQAATHTEYQKHQND